MLGIFLDQVFIEAGFAAMADKPSILNGFCAVGS